MARSALPQNFLLNEGAVFEDFEDIVLWGAVTNGTKADNASEYVTGSKSMKLTGTGGNITLTKTLVTPLDLSAYNGDIGIRVYCHTDYDTTIDNITIYLSQDGTYINYFSYTLEESFFLNNDGWQLCRIPRNAWDATGSPSWDNISRIKITIVPQSGQLPIVSLDSLTAGIVGKPQIMIMFDDANDDVYVDAYAYMQPRGIPGTIFVNSADIDNSGKCTTANLTTMYGEGWSFGNHTTDHTNLTTLSTAAEIIAKVIPCTEWLDAHGFTRASRHLAFPWGQSNSFVKSTIESEGILTGRIVSPINTTGFFMRPPVRDLFRLPCAPVEGETTLAQAKTAIDYAISRGQTVAFLFHNINDAAASGITARADFQAIIDYIVERKIDAVTIDEWYEGLTNPRYRAVPLARATV